MDKDIGYIMGFVDKTTREHIKDLEGLIEDADKYDSEYKEQYVAYLKLLITTAESLRDVIREKVPEVFIE